MSSLYEVGEEMEPVTSPPTVITPKKIVPDANDELDAGNLNGEAQLTEENEAMSNEPVSESVEPESESIEPESESIEPESEPIEPESESIEPESRSVEPESESIEQESAEVFKEAKSSEPVVEMETDSIKQAVEASKSGHLNAVQTLADLSASVEGNQTDMSPEEQISKKTGMFSKELRVNLGDLSQMPSPPPKAKSKIAKREKGKSTMPKVKLTSKVKKAKAAKAKAAAITKHVKNATKAAAITKHVKNATKAAGGAKNVKNATKTKSAASVKTKARSDKNKRVKVSPFSKESRVIALAKERKAAKAKAAGLPTTKPNTNSKNKAKKPVAKPKSAPEPTPSKKDDSRGRPKKGINPVGKSPGTSGASAKKLKKTPAKTAAKKDQSGSSKKDKTAPKKENRKKEPEVPLKKLTKTLYSYVKAIPCWAVRTQYIDPKGNVVKSEVTEKQGSATLFKMMDFWSAVRELERLKADVLFLTSEQQNPPKKRPTKDSSRQDKSPRQSSPKRRKVEETPKTNSQDEEDDDDLEASGRRSGRKRKPPTWLQEFDNIKSEPKDKEELSDGEDFDDDDESFEEIDDDRDEDFEATSSEDEFLPKSRMDRKKSISTLRVSSMSTPRHNKDSNRALAGKLFPKDIKFGSEAEVLYAAAYGDKNAKNMLQERKTVKTVLDDKKTVSTLGIAARKPILSDSAAVPDSSTPALESYKPPPKKFYLSDFRTYSCAPCLKSFTCQDMLARHEEQHIRQTCVLCDRLCPSEIALKVHLSNGNCCKVIHPETGTICHKCRFCSSLYDTQELLQAHMDTLHKPYEKEVFCIDCDRQYSNVLMYARHRARTECMRPFICDICRKVFPGTMNNKFKAHMLKHRTDVPEGKFCCELCGTDTAGFNELIAHMEQAHDNVYTCSECGHTEKELNQMHQHVKVHNDPKQYLCQKCGETFKNIAHLCRHRNRTTCGGGTLEPGTVVKRGRQKKSVDLLEEHSVAQQLVMLGDVGDLDKAVTAQTVNEAGDLTQEFLISVAEPETTPEGDVVKIETTDADLNIQSFTNSADLLNQMAFLQDIPDLNLAPGQEIHVYINKV